MILIKYIFVVLCFSIFSINNIFAESPIDKGVYSLSGSISLRKIDSKENDNVTKSYFSPSFGYFIFNNLLIGTSFNYTSAKQGDFISKNYTAGPSIRYYIPLHRVFVFGGVNYLFGKGSSDNGNKSNLNKSTQELLISSGIDIFLSKNVAVEPSISYSIFKHEFSGANILPNTEGDGNTYSLNIRINVFIF